MKFVFIFLLCGFCFSLELITPIESQYFDPEKALLGKKIFFDIRLGRDGKISCESCHNMYINQSGTSDKLINGINPPTVLNIASNNRFFHDGKIRTLKKQVQRSFTSNFEMGVTPDYVVNKVKKNTLYVKKFKKIYSDGITFDNIIDAVVNYEKTLITPNSKFDMFLKGEAFLDDNESRGYRLFKDLGCILCHNGSNLGANNFSYSLNQRYVRVPILRNITKTSPYFINASTKNLKNAIAIMAQINSKKIINENQINDILSFLKTLESKVVEIHEKQ